MNDILTYIPWRYLLLFIGTGATLWRARTYLRPETERIIIAAALAGTTSALLTDLFGLFSIPIRHSEWIAFSVELFLLSFMAYALLDRVPKDRER